MLRIARRSDFAALSGLWKEAFLEDSESAQFIFEAFAAYENCYVWEESDQIVGMLCAVPCSFCGYNGAYLYGVATRFSYRGQGIMSRMIPLVEQTLLQKGIVFTVLVPASESLFSFYEKFGYQSVSGRNHFEISVPLLPSALPEQFPTPVLPEVLQKLRMKWLSCDEQVSLCPQAWQAICEDLNAGHTQMLLFHESYAVFRLSQQKLWVEEIAAENWESFQMLLAKAAQVVSDKLSKPIHKAEGILLEGIHFPKLPILRKPFAMGKRLGQEKFQIEKAWMNLMLN